MCSVMTNIVMFKEMTNVSSNQSSLFHKYIYKIQHLSGQGLLGGSEGDPGGSRPLGHWAGFAGVPFSSWPCALQGLVNEKPLH